MYEYVTTLKYTIQHASCDFCLTVKLSSALSSCIQLLLLSVPTFSSVLSAAHSGLTVHMMSTYMDTVTAVINSNQQFLFSISIPVSSTTRTDSISTYTSNHQPPPAPIGIRSAEELHDPHNEGSEAVASCLAEHHGCLCQGTLAGLEGEFNVLVLVKLL